MREIRNTNYLLLFLTRSLYDEERQKSVCPPVRPRILPPDVETPHVEGDGEADVGQGHHDRGAELTDKDANQAGLWNSEIESDLSN